MANNKRCLIYETLGKVSDLKVCESKSDGLVRLEGVFGVCGVRNNNNRIYDKDNYKQMVESLQNVINTEGCPGELEHPNTMNINLQNVSHKIESIQMNEDGTITGTIALLNTPKGKIAQAIIEGGLPLYISSRAAGTMTTESGVNHVVLSNIKTYDLVGTPGFSQAKMSLKENQTLECLNESVNDGNIMYAIVEGEDLLSLDSEDDKKSDDKKSDDKKSDDKKSNDKKSDDKKEKKDEAPKNEPKDIEDNTEENNNKNNNSETDMNDVMHAINKLTDRIASLEAQLHVAKESLEETNKVVESIQPVQYQAIEKWVTEECLEDFKTYVNEAIESKLITYSENIQNWVTEEFAPQVQGWVTEEFAPQVQAWVTEEFAPEVQNWVTEEFAPEVQGWVTEEFAPQVQGWVTEEFAPVIDSWINEEFANEQIKKINENVSAFLAENKAGRLDEIDSILETLSTNKSEDLEKIVKEQEMETKYKGVYVVENMPAQYIPSWQMLSEARQQEIIRTSKMYDFTKEGVLESFWDSVDFTEHKQEEINETLDPMSQYQMSVAKRMKSLSTKW